MTDQEYYQQLLDKFKNLGFKGTNLYTQANTEFSRWKASQQDKMLEEQLPEVTVKAPRITSSTINNSDNTPITRRYFNTDLQPEDKAALQKGVTYDAKKARLYEREAQTAANKVGLGLGAVGLSVAAAPIIGTGIGAGLNGYAAFQAAHPIIATGIDVAGTVDGIRNFFSGNGVQKTARLIKEGNFGRAALSGVGDAFDIMGTGQFVNLGRKIITPAYRAGHAYVSIRPWGYSNPIERGKTFVKSLLTGKEADVSIPKWDAASEDVFDRNHYKVESDTRDDAWRKYLRLPETHNMYIQNSDGTYRYNLDKIVKIQERPVYANLNNADFRPKVYRDKEPYKRFKGQDWVTSAGGGLTGNYVDVIRKRQDGYFDAIQTIEDVWDLQPLQKSASHMATDLEYKYPILKKKPFTFIPKTIRKIGNIEIGPIVGGKPFTMKTEIPFNTNRDGLKSKYDKIVNWKAAEQNPDKYYDLYKQVSDSDFEQNFFDPGFNLKYYSNIKWKK